MDDTGCSPGGVAIGCLIREIRESLGWSRSRLAVEVCRLADHHTVSGQDVSRWERGKRTPGPWWLRHLAAALDGGYPSPDDWDAALDSYGRDYMTSGAAEIQKRLTADLVVLQQQLGTPRRWAVAAKLATLYAKTFPGADGVKAVTWYRHAATFADRSGDNVFISLIAAGLGDGALAPRAQDEAFRALPESLPRFRTHLLMHRGLMLTQAGDQPGGAAYARAASVATAGAALKRRSFAVCSHRPHTCSCG